MSLPIDEIWIVKGKLDDDGGWVYLPDYAGLSRHDTEMKVMDGASREGFKGTLAEWLEYLRWEIVKVRLVEGPVADTTESDMHERVELVLRAARARFMQDGADSQNAIITALEGLKWALGLDPEGTPDDMRQMLEEWAVEG